MYLPVKDDEVNDSILTVLKCDPLIEFNDDETAAPVQQTHRKSGLPLWTVTVAYEHENDFEPENCQVRIAADGDPGIVPGPIRFGGLAFRTWNMNGKKGLSIAADSWTQEPRPSSRRPSKPDMPPAPAETTSTKGEANA